MTQETQKPKLNTSIVRHSFFIWIEEYNPDYVSKKILSSLLYEYENGNKLPLFEKFKQLIDSELYVLATIFRDCLVCIGINDEFKAWLISANSYPSKTHTNN